MQDSDSAHERWPEGIIQKDCQIDLKGSLQNFTIVLHMIYRDSSGFKVQAEPYLVSYCKRSTQKIIPTNIYGSLIDHNTTGFRLKSKGRN